MGTTVVVLLVILLFYQYDIYKISRASFVVQIENKWAKKITTYVKALHYGTLSDPINLEPYVRLLTFFDVYDENDFINEVTILAETAWAELDDTRELVITEKTIRIAS